MTTIDHRILIPAPPDVVWHYVSDITHNPDWQIDCREVLFLTSRREGPGVRWRYAKPDGHECVVAVSAWYNGLGYEYYFVDGMPFRENKGRIRLQEIPEGTIVQWTFTYELGGLFGGVRNALGVSREVDHTIADSLKTLWQKIKQSTGTVSRVYEAKSLMRDAPDVEARSNYRPRHPSAADAHADGTAPEQVMMPEPPIREGDGQPISIIAEPPVADEDTRPRVAVSEAAEAVPVPADMDGEPEFLDRVGDLSRFEPPRDLSDTQPKQAAAPPAPAEMKPEPVPLKGEETEPLGFTPPETLPGYAPPLPDEREEPTAPAAILADETQPEYASEPLAAANIDDEPEPAEASTPEPEAVTPSAILDTPVTTPEAAPAEPPTTVERPAEPTAGSIWEVFGVPRPSEVSQSTTDHTEPESAAAETPMSREPAPPLNGTTHGGLRMALRRKLVRVRRM